MPDENARAARAILTAEPDAWLAQPGRLCGDGTTCDQPGTWGLRGWVHAYCPVCALVRLRGEQQ